MQGANGFGGLAFGACFEPFAQQDQGDDNGRAFKVQVWRVTFVCGEPQPNRQQPARRSAQRHQQIHVAGERFEREPAGSVKAGPQYELHRRGQCKLNPGRQHPMLAPQITQHGQDQRCRQQQTQSHWRKTSPWRGVVGCGFRVFRRAGLVACLANRTA